MTTDMISSPTFNCAFYDSQCEKNVTYKQMYVEHCNQTEERCVEKVPNENVTAAWHLCYIEYGGEPATVHRRGCLPEDLDCNDFCASNVNDNITPFICCCQGNRCNAGNGSFSLSTVVPLMPSITTTASDSSATPSNSTQEPTLSSSKSRPSGKSSSARLHYWRTSILSAVAAVGLLT